MTTLADINQTLQANTDIIESVDKNIDGIKTGILGLFALEKEKRLDELEASREFKKSNGQATGSNIQQIKSAENNDNNTMFDMLKALGIAGAGEGILKGVGKAFSLAALARLFKKGFIGALATLFADEIGAGVKALTGSDIAGALTEAGIVGGSFGFMFGPKGAIVGALASATFVATGRLRDYIEKELKGKTDWAPIIAESARGTTNIATLATVGGLVLGPLGAIAGAVIGGAASLYATYERYQTDPKFKELVDKKAGEIKSNIENSLIAAGNLILDSLNAIADPFITTKDEKDAFKQARPERAKLLDETQYEVNVLAKKAVEAKGIQNLSKADQDEYFRQRDLLKQLQEERDAFLNSDNRAAMLRRGASQGGMTFEQAAEAYGTSRTSAVPATAQEMIQYVAIKRDSATNIPSYIRSQKPGSIAQERMLATHFGISDMTKTKELAREMNLSLIDYLEKYRTVGVNSSPIVAPVTNNTSIGQSSTAFVGSGVNTLDTNNPNAMRAMERAIVR
jgi:hypothetical protein